MTRNFCIQKFKNVIQIVLSRTIETLHITTLRYHRVGTLPTNHASALALRTSAISPSIRSSGRSFGNLSLNVPPRFARNWQSPFNLGFYCILAQHTLYHHQMGSLYSLIVNIWAFQDDDLSECLTADCRLWLEGGREGMLVVLFNI